MKGSSGAELHQRGDLVTKRSLRANNEAAWLRLAPQHPLADGINIVRVYSEEECSYTMQHITGHVATHEPQATIMDRLCEQLLIWRTLPATNSVTWKEYTQRLQEHASLVDSDIINEAMWCILTHDALPASFNHGDLTLENILIDADGTAWIIDPNHQPDLYQSWLLDAGKLLQSTHTNYHKAFQSSAGTNLARHDARLCNWLKQHNIYEPALLACLTHIIRLCRYRPQQVHIINTLIEPLLKELQWKS